MSPAVSAPSLRVDPRFLPMSRAEMDARGWDAVDIVFVTGDAYIDHYSFAMAILGRVLEKAGFRVAILSQPDWKSAEPWKRFGRPRLFFAVSAGNMDSMINHYTANKKVRNDDAYSPGGKIGLRPDRATIPYCQRAREAFPGVTVIAGGVEASLRRMAHYDYWSDKVRPSILMDSKADLVCYGMGEETIVEIARRIQAGKTVKECRDLRGVAYALGASETAPSGPDIVELPSYEDVLADKDKFLKAAHLIHRETSPFNAKTVVQRHGARAVVVTPPQLPLTEGKMDEYYGLAYTRRAHPAYTAPIPAWEMIKDSVTIMRGCFGGCTFCSITAHQGRTIQSRSEASVLGELEALAADPQFKGTVSDLGGPTANMYKMRCTKPEIEKICKRLPCVSPTICKCLGTDHGPLVKLMNKADQVPGVNKVLVASGIRMDLARLSPEYMRDLTSRHVGGRLKVAPEHVSPKVLALMKKPTHDTFEDFAEKFKRENDRAGKKQFVVPYFIASHPGSDLNAMIELAVFLKQRGYRPDQVQDFIPSPMDLAAAMYYTGKNPETGEPMPVAKGMRERKLQRALL
ncbi:MAG: YgiQ family radical SAM protein, partial [Elusimicrobia bacterium]|nr:YgiQ family radical SAM protein [Elusimicrobiota bacterium]